MSFDVSVEHLLQEEGGLVNHPKDPGGITKYGISLKAYPKFGAEGIKKLTKEIASTLYYTDYWTPSLCGILPPAVACMQLDTAVNMGVGSSIKILQQCLSLTADGIAGKRTLQGVQHVRNMTDTELADLIRKYAQYRMAEYRRRRNFETFGKGWFTRTKRVRDFSISMLGGNKRG